MDIKKPADRSAAYQPRVRPKYVATKEPATPRAIVIQMPPGSFPGMNSLAKAPTIRPMISAPIKENIVHLQAQPCHPLAITSHTEDRVSEINALTRKKLLELRPSRNVFHFSERNEAPGILLTMRW